MAVTNPQHFIDQISTERWEMMAGRGSLRGISSTQEPNWVEPASPSEAVTNEGVVDVNQLAMPTSQGDEINEKKTNESGGNANAIIRGKVQRLGDFVDTDAVCSFPSTTMIRTPRLTNNSWHRLSFSSRLTPTKTLELTVLNLQILPSAHELKRALTS